MSEEAKQDLAYMHASCCLSVCLSTRRVPIPADQLTKSKYARNMIAGMV